MLRKKNWFSLEKKKARCEKEKKFQEKNVFLFRKKKK